jgi:hypothetical protein
LQEIALAIKICEAFDVNEEVQSLERSEDYLMDSTFAKLYNLGVHGMHGFEEINNDVDFFLKNLCCLYSMSMEDVIFVFLLEMI